MVDRTSMKGIPMEVLKRLAIPYCTKYRFENAVGGSQFWKEGR